MAFRAVISGVSSGLALAQHHLKQGAVAGAIARRANLLHSLLKVSPAGLFLLIRMCAMRIPCKRQRRISSHAGVPDIVIANAGASIGALAEAVMICPGYIRTPAAAINL